jgi:hypothetical protein
VLEISDNATVDKLASPPLGQLLMDYYASKNHVTLTTTRVPGKGSSVHACFPLPVAAMEGTSGGES